MDPDSVFGPIYSPSSYSMRRPGGFNSFGSWPRFLENERYGGGDRAPLSAKERASRKTARKTAKNSRRANRRKK